MNNRNTVLALIIAAIFVLHIANALYQGKMLPNCARTNDEGMNSWDMQFTDPFSVNTSYPPLYGFNSYFIEKLVGKNWTLLYVFNNSMYFLLLLIFLYLLGKAVKDTETGLLSALIVSLYPLVAAGYNRYCMDFALLSLIVIFLYFLYRSDYFLNTGYSVLAGVAVVYGVMLKESFPAFIAGPVLYVFYQSLKDILRRSFKRIITISVIFISTVAVAISFFGFNYFYFLFWQSMLLEPVNHVWTGFGTFLFYHIRLFWIGLWESQLSIPFFLLLIPGIYCFAKEKDTRLQITVFSSIIIPNLFVMLMPHWKSERHLLPQLAVLAFISAFSLRKLIDSYSGKAIISLLIIVGILQVYDFTYDKIGLSKLEYKSFYYWHTEYMELSVNTKLKKTETCINIFKALLDNINETERTGIKKNKYKVLVLPAHAMDSKGIVLLHSYFLFNLGKYVKDKDYYSLVRRLNASGDKTVGIDYIIQAATKDSKRESLYNLNMLEQILRETAENASGQVDLKIMENKWASLVKNFEDRGLIYRGKEYDFYLYQRRAISSYMQFFVLPLKIYGVAK
ncbi:MAG: glycosyltransferase family 39 protein [Elusimicrobia bacterium]|nr:glycosyltransferase family 39 protein [Candidatus Liberimonas magnetica]